MSSSESGSESDSSRSDWNPVSDDEFEILDEGIALQQPGQINFFAVPSYHDNALLTYGGYDYTFERVVKYNF